MEQEEAEQAIRQNEIATTESPADQVESHDDRDIERGDEKENQPAVKRIPMGRGGGRGDRQRQEKEDQPARTITKQNHQTTQDAEDHQAYREPRPKRRNQVKRVGHKIDALTAEFSTLLKGSRWEPQERGAPECLHGPGVGEESQAR